jgi:hypothetical protein
LFDHLKRHEDFFWAFATLLDSDGSLRQRGITVNFNWPRFLAQGWPIRLETRTVLADLERCFLPWYLGQAGVEVNYDAPDAKPLRLSDVASRLAALRANRQSGIRAKEAEMRSDSGLATFATPVYALPHGEFIAMDRCHRLSALMLAKQPFSVTLCVVEGPLDPACLNDLKHWQIGS